MLLISLYPSALPHLVSTLSILLSHLQTVAIIGTLRLAWPASSRTIISSLGLSGLDLAALRHIEATQRLLLLPFGSEEGRLLEEKNVFCWHRMQVFAIFCLK